MGTPSTYWDLVQEELKKLPEEGPLPRETVAVWAWWHEQMVNDLESRGWTYRGTSIKYNEWSTLLVVKVTVDGIPHVGFITERNTTGCMRLFRRMLEESRLELRVDKFG